MTNQNDKKLLGMDYVDGADQLIDRYLTTTRHEPKTAHRLALWLQAECEEHGLTTNKLAAKMNVDVEMVELILEGKAYASAFDDDLIRALAQATGATVGLVAMLLGKPLQTDSKVAFDVKHQEARNNHDEVVSYFLDILANPRSEKMLRDEDEFSTLIDRLQEIIVQQRRELQFLKDIKERLENPETAGDILAPVHPDGRAYSARDIKRMIEHFLESVG